MTFAFDYSAKRLLAFQESLCQDVLVREEMKTCKVKNFVRNTMGRWGWFFIHFSNSLPRRSTVTRDSFRRWRWEGNGVFVFQQTILISSSPFLLLKMYFLTQSPYKRCFKESNVNLIEAAEEVSVVINVMNTERNDPSVWKELYEQGKQLAANVDNTQQHRANRDFKQRLWKRLVQWPEVIFPATHQLLKFKVPWRLQLSKCCFLMKNKFALFHFFSRSLQVVYFVKCRQTHTSKFIFICLCPQ